MGGLFIICAQLRDERLIALFADREGKKARPRAGVQDSASQGTTFNAPKSSSHHSCFKASVTPRSVSLSQGLIRLIERMGGWCLGQQAQGLRGAWTVGDGEAQPGQEGA